MVARNDPIKGHIDFLDAIANIPNCHGVIIGDGITRSQKILEKIKTLDINKKINLFDQKTDINKIISSFDILVSASYSEGFPTVIAEAMSCEVPVVATNVGDTSAILGNIDGLININDVNALTEKIKTIQKLSVNERLKIGNKLRSRIENKFSSKIMIEKYNNIYFSLSSKKYLSS